MYSQLFYFISRLSSITDSSTKNIRTDLAKRDNGSVAENFSSNDGMENQVSSPNDAQPIIINTKLLESSQLQTAQDNSSKEAQQKSFLLQVSKGSRKSVSIIVPTEGIE